jgi:hypothetical protein
VLHLSISLATTIVIGFLIKFNNLHHISDVINMTNVILSVIFYGIKLYIIKFCIDSIDSVEDVICLDLIIFGIIYAISGTIPVALSFMTIMLLYQNLYVATIVLSALTFVFSIVLFILFIPFVQTYKNFIDERLKYNII